MRAVPAQDLGQRLANNPILSSRDVAPPPPPPEVVSVFNAAAATVGEETILLLRVGERPRVMTGLLPATARTLDPTAPEKGLQSLPNGMLGENAIGLAFLDPATEPPRIVVAYVPKDLPGVDLSDPRTIRVRVPPARSEER